VPTSATASTAGTSRDHDSLATFVRIGPGEAGTTWVYGLLKAHSEVWVTTAKETMFFDASYHKGVDC
jgi:hypothetical protein